MTQQKALEILKSGKNVFLTGEPGAGKTYTINLFTEYMRDNRIEYAITASTGIAATHIDGTTIHSWSGLGINRVVDDNLIDKLMFNRFVTRRLCGAQVLVIDEISMLDKTMINNIDYVLRNVRQKDHPFGGLQVVFVGDFFQLPPVVKNEKVEYAFEAGAWKDADPVVCYLTEQHRQSDPEFLEILTAMRSGDITEAHKARLLQCFNNPRPETQLYTHNVDVDRVNFTELAKIQDRMHIFKGESDGVPHIAEQLKKDCLSPEKLELKKGAVVMFTKNNFEAGYVNGTIGKVHGFRGHDDAPIVEIHNGTLVTLVPAKWVREEKGIEVASFTQYPLRLAWAITVHKSQGMSLDAASIDLSKTFAYGQGYVAISRVRSLDGLHLQGINENIFAMAPVVIERDNYFRYQSKQVEGEV